MLLELLAVAVAVEAAAGEEEEPLPPPLRPLVRARVQAREHVLVEGQAVVWKSTVAQAVEVATMFKHQSQNHPRWTRSKNTNRRRYFSLRLGFRFGSLSRPRGSSASNDCTSNRSSTSPATEATRGCSTDPCRGWRLPRSSLASLLFFLGLFLGESLSLSPGKLLTTSSSGAGARTRRWLNLSLLRLLLKWIF